MINSKIALTGTGLVDFDAAPSAGVSAFAAVA
jgi:hypothetical protein